MFCIHTNQPLRVRFLGKFWKFNEKLLSAVVVVFVAFFFYFSLFDKPLFMIFSLDDDTRYVLQMFKENRSV